MQAPYEAQYPVGTRVRIADRASLERFAREWQRHNPLTEEQLPFGGNEANFAEVGYCHGGDVLYRLDGIPGIWHPQCPSGV